MVQTDVLETVVSESLSVFVVWEPIFRTDSAKAARKATTLLPDRRVESFWVESLRVGELFQPSIGLESEPAWDVYLVFPPGAMWEGETPPRPEFFMHQLGGRLPEAQSLDGPGLARAIEEALRLERRDSPEDSKEQRLDSRGAISEVES